MERKISGIAIAYFICGIIFAIIYALFYHWEALSLFSPQFYLVALSWPFQLPGLISDFMIYGLSGKILD